ncbi:hypothetical protein D3C72_2084180 [compost metagenome]
MLGIVPASTARIHSNGTGARICAAVINASSMVMLNAVTHGSTLFWPSRSTNFDTCGPMSAFDSVNIPATAPANQ